MFMVSGGSGYGNCRRGRVVGGNWDEERWTIGRVRPRPFQICTWPPEWASQNPGRDVYLLTAQGFAVWGLKLPRIRFLVALLLLWSCYRSAATDKAGLRLASHLGVAVQKSDTACLYIHNAELAAGSPLTLVVLTPPQSIAKAEIVGPASENCPSIDKSDSNMKLYRIRLLERNPLPTTPAIAVSGFSGRFQTRGKYVTADIDGDGRPEFFRFCASSEGIHMTVWSGKLLRGKPRWHQYYYLGYDVEANCSPEDTETARP